jgi:hypothetical protein
VTNFNHELIERIKVYMKDRQGTEIDDELAEEYLNALADFYDAFGELLNKKK